MGPTTSKDLNTVIKSLKRDGWQYSMAGKHVKLFPPNSSGAFVVVSKSPSDRRVIKNLQKNMRKVAGEI